MNRFSQWILGLSRDNREIQRLTQELQRLTRERTQVNMDYVNLRYALRDRIEELKEHIGALEQELKGDDLTNQLIVAIMDLERNTSALEKFKSETQGKLEVIKAFIADLEQEVRDKNSNPSFETSSKPSSDTITFTLG